MKREADRKMDIKRNDEYFFITLLSADNTDSLLLIRFLCLR